MTMDLQIILPILFPLVGVLVNAFFGRRLGERGDAGHRDRAASR